jgi:competence protein ComEC
VRYTVTLHGRHALEVLHAHPRHVVLLGLVAGLLAAGGSMAVILTAMLIAGALGGLSPLGLLASIAAMGGAVIAQERVEALDRGPLAELVGEHVSGAAVLLEPPRARRYGGASGRVRWLDGPAAGDVGLARFPAASGDEPGTTELRVGEILALSSRVAELETWEEFQRRRGARAALEVDGVRRTGRWRAGLHGWLDSIRERGRLGLEAGAPHERAAVLRGMVLGDDHAIDERVRADFERSGLAHLLAVSGQNVMLLSCLVLAAGAAVGAPLTARLSGALVLVLLYVPLTGAGPSIQRAGVMGAAGLVAGLAGRPASRWYALILAAAVTLVLSPRAIADPGWQLSFAAVLGLLAGASRLTEGLSRRGCPRLPAEVTALTILATLATAPLLAYHFGELSLVSLPSNLIAAPAVAPVMWLGMLSIAVAQVDPALATPLTTINGVLVAYVEWVAHIMAAPAHATLGLELSWPVGVLGAYVAIGALAVGVPVVWRSTGGGLRRRLIGGDGGRLLSGRRRGVLPAVAVAIVVTVLAGPARSMLLDGPATAPPSDGELVVSFLDVGQGDATLLQTDDSAVLFDTGPPDGPILDRLREAGVKRLDALVITHAEADHEGAALAVMDSFGARMILNGGAGWSSPIQSRLEGAARKAGSRMVVAHAGQSVRLDGMRLKTLWPPPPTMTSPSGDRNQRSLVVHVERGGFDLLLPADAESDVLARLALPRVDVLKVSHHGSEDPGLPAVLDRLRPSVAAIEVGRGNSYGHPASTTVAALKAVPHVWRTDRDGTVRLRVSADEIHLDP